MADRSTIARPYARAAFDEARGEASAWAPGPSALNTGAAVVTDERVHDLLDNPTRHAGPARAARHRDRGRPRTKQAATSC